MSIRGATDTEWSDAEELAAHRAVLFKKCVDAGAAACFRGDFAAAIRLYQDAIELDPTNHVLYSNRSAIYCKLKNFEAALSDANKSYELKPSWNKALYRKGYALKCMGQYVQALQAYSVGLSQDPKNRQLLFGLIECVQQCPLKERFSNVYDELKSLGYDKNAFVLISVVGQELLSVGHTTEAVEILESALKIDTTNLELRQSVLSALSSAYWTLGAMKKALHVMDQDLAIAISLGNASSEARARGNLGMVHLTMGNLKEALNNYRHHLMLNLRSNDKRTAAATLSTMGQIYMRLFDYENSLASFEQCLDMLKNSFDDHESDDVFCNNVDVYRQYGHMGDVYLSMGRDKDAELMYDDHLTSARRDSNVVEESRALMQLGALCQYRGDRETAGRHFLSSYKLARQCRDRNLEMHLCGYLCQICLSLRNFDAARRWSEKQLQLALLARDNVGESKACANLGAVEFQRGDVENARKIFQRQLDVAKTSGDDNKNLILTAYRNLGLCYEQTKRTRDAVECHTAELCLAKELNDKMSECIAHGCLASLYQTLRATDQAETHLQRHWTLAKETRNVKTESLALRNVGKFYAAGDDYERSVEYFEKYLMLAQEQNDVDAEKEACRELGDVHRRLERYREAVRYFDQELALARDLRDHRTMARAYRDLGLVRASLNELDEAMECQKYFLALAHITHESEMKLQALYNIGDVLLRRGKYALALKIFCKQLSLARTCPSKFRAYESSAYGKIGESYDNLSKFERARQCYAEQLRIGREIDDVARQLDAYRRLGNHYRWYAKNVTSSIHSYENQLELARSTRNFDVELEALKNLCDLCRDASMFDDSTRYLQERVKILTNLRTNRRWRRHFKRALLDLAECYAATNNVVDSIKIYDDYFLNENNNDDDDDESFDVDYVRRSLDLGKLWFKIGNFQKAFTIFQRCCEISQNFTRETYEIRLLCVFCLMAAKKFDEALIKTKESLNFFRKSSSSIIAAHWEGNILLTYAYLLAKTNETTSALNFGKEALNLARRYDDVELLCACFTFFGTMKTIDDDLNGARTYFQQIFDVSTSKRTMENWKLLSLYNLSVICLLSENFDGCRQFLNQAIKLAVSSNDLASEVELRVVSALHHWIRRQLNEAKNEFECALKIVEKRSFYLNSDEFLPSGCESRLFLAQTLCMLLIVLLKTMNLEREILLVCEKCRYFRCVSTFERDAAVDGRKRLQNCAPNEEKIDERIKTLLADDSVVFYYFSVENYVFTWKFLKDSRNFEIFHVNRTENDSSLLMFSSDILRKFVLKNLFLNENFGSQSTSSFVDVLSDDIGRLSLDVDRLLLIGVDRQINFVPNSKIASRILSYDASLTNFTSKLHAIPPQLLTSGLVVDGDRSTSKSLTSIATSLNVDVVRSSTIYKDELMSKLCKSRCVHLRLPLTTSNDAFSLSSAVDANDDDSVDDAEQRIFRIADVLKQTVRATVTFLSFDAVDQEIPTFVVDFASALLLAGCRCVLFFRPSYVDDARAATFYERFYDLLIVERETASKAVQTACQHANLSTKFVVVYGDSNVILDQACLQISRPLQLLLQTPDDCREAMLLVLHLVEKSLQRIYAGLSKPMFASEQSVRNKAGPEVHGVFELLEALGFHREAPTKAKTSSSEEPSLYFPLNDASGCLTRGSLVLQAFLSLPQGLYVAFSKLTKCGVAVGSLLTLVYDFYLENVEKDICTTSKIHKYELKINRDVYSIAGAAELFAALGFDKLKEDDKETTMETIRIELTNKKLQNTLVCFRAIFDDVIHRDFNDNSDDSNVESSPDVAKRTTKLFSTSSLPPPLTDVATTDLSGIESDFPLDESLFGAMSLERPTKTTKNKHNRRGGKWKHQTANSDGKSTSSGYMSEGDLKGGKKKKSTAERGYYSEDENKKQKPTSAAGDSSPTAQVLSVDERSSPFDDDLGFHDDADDLPPPPPVPTTTTCKSTKNIHEYVRLETPTPHVVASRIRYNSPPVPPTRPPPPPPTKPLVRPPPPPYNLCRSTRNGTNASPVTTTFDSDAEILRRTAQKIVFPRQTVQTSSLNGSYSCENNSKRNSTSSPSFSCNNFHNSSSPCNNYDRVFTNGSQYDNNNLQRSVHENRVLLAREDSFPAEFI